MPVTYQPAPPDVVALTKRLAEAYHPHLVENHVRIDVVMAYAAVNEDGEKVGEALMLHGYPCLGIASITKLKERVKGDGDCEIALDGDRWPELSARRREALVDHELTHFDMLTDDCGMQLYDDLGRPRLSMRKHDFDVGWFHCIAGRYGMDSGEVGQFIDLCSSLEGKLYTGHLDGSVPKLGFGNPPAEKPKTGREARKKTKLERAQDLVKQFARLGHPLTLEREMIMIPHPGEIDASLLVEVNDHQKEIRSILSGGRKEMQRA